MMRERTEQRVWRSYDLPGGYVVTDCGPWCFRIPEGRKSSFPDSFSANQLVIHLSGSCYQNYDEGADSFFHGGLLDIAMVLDIDLIRTEEVLCVGKLDNSLEGVDFNEGD